MAESRHSKFQERPPEALLVPGIGLSHVVSETTDRPCEQACLPCQTQAQRPEHHTAAFSLTKAAVEGHSAVLQGILGLKACFHGKSEHSHKLSGGDTSWIRTITGANVLQASISKSLVN